MSTGVSVTGRIERQFVGLKFGKQHVRATTMDYERDFDTAEVVLSADDIVAIGLTVGGVGAIASAYVVRRFLFGISPFDPPTLATVCAILLVAAFGALHLPARWASRLEPAQTLRGE